MAEVFGSIRHCPATKESPWNSLLEISANKHWQTPIFDGQRKFDYRLVFTQVALLCLKCLTSSLVVISAFTGACGRGSDGLRPFVCVGKGS